MNISIDYEMSLADMRATGATYVEIGKLLGLNKHAIFMMEKTGRNIYLKQIDGQWHYMETKDWRRAEVKEGKPKRGRPPTPKADRSDAV